MIPGSESVTLVQRRGERDPTTGRFEVSEAKVTVTASIQPASGPSMERLPEGFRIDDVRILYLRRGDLVKAANPKYGVVGDHFEFADSGYTDRWAVQIVSDWRRLSPVDHYEVVVTRIKETEEED